MTSAVSDLRSYLECPIIAEQMQDPYIVIACGHSFERVDWLFG